MQNSSKEILKEALKKKLKTQGFKITGPRLAIIEYLIATDDHPDIQDIHNKVIKLYPGIGVATVYRTLQLFQRLHVVNVIELNDGRQRYEINMPHDHHHHLVCTECRRVVEFGNCNFPQLIENIEAATRFKIHSHSTIAYGKCPQCSINN